MLPTTKLIRHSTYAAASRRLLADQAHVSLSQFPKSLAPFLHPRQLSSSRPTSTDNTPKLSKPDRFNPPSHPSRLPRQEPTYLGRSYNFPKDAPAPKEDSSYPHTLPPPNTWHYWFLTNKSLHFYLSLTILFTLAAFVSVSNFMKTSKFAYLVTWNWSHPVQSVASFINAYRLNTLEKSRQALEKRKQKLEDFEKRGEYRRAHGLEQTGNESRFGGWGLRRDEDQKPVVVNDASPTNGSA